MDDPRQLLMRMFEAAVDAASPSRHLKHHLPEPPIGRTVVVGAGKAAASMAQALESAWPGKLEGIVISPYKHNISTHQIQVPKASHPLPDESGVQATRRIIDLVEPLGADDLVLCLVSGGGSALLTLPVDGISLEHKRSITRALLKSGATIGEINCVRRHLSQVKGGHLAALAWPARTVTLAISDVPGDKPEDIASGPTVVDPTTFADASAVLEKYNIAVPAPVRMHIDHADTETIKPGDPRLSKSDFHLIVSPMHSLEVAAELAAQTGYDIEILGDHIEGEACAVARQHAERVFQHDRSRPFALISGGELTVRVEGDGRGGPNQEYALALAAALGGAPGVHAIACDTDGIDGDSNVAGAMIGPDTLLKARDAGLFAENELANNNSYGFFHQIGDSVTCGPTLTNVNDFRVILIDPV